MFYVVGALLAFSVVLGLGLSLFLIDPRDFIKTQAHLFLSVEKKDLFKRYLEAEESYKNKVLPGSDWDLKRKIFLDEYQSYL